jgi:hypothetical protein
MRRAPAVPRPKYLPSTLAYGWPGDGMGDQRAPPVQAALDAAATTLLSYLSAQMVTTPYQMQQALAQQQALRSALGLPTSEELSRQQLAGSYA